jgi:metallophosphoesterase superfamily enzyme
MSTSAIPQPASPSTGSAAIVAASRELRLLPQRALLDTASRSLMVADLHLGKAATFRAHGLPVPSGTTE